ncbi:MAG: T9SS type A sorting domain-containing protein [Ignavibacterium sp.]|jgi:hypothetical protein|nr:T9SS type A sorting domain-containing protein [Ignavibacterium sp.]
MMRKLNFCIVVIFLLIQINLYSQQIDKVIISGLGGSHDSNVKTAFQIGYTSYNSIPFPGEIILLQNNIQESFDYAIGNDFDLIIRSTTGLSTGIRLAPNYPTVRLVMPAGSNDHIQTFFGDVVSSPVVITGAGIDSNQTAYKLEFFSIDPITGTNLSSYANGYIAGQIAFISNTLDVSFDSARTLARIYGSENGELDFRNGFGKIPVSKIINEALPVELISFTGKIIGSNVVLNWNTATEINNYGFEVERQTNNTGWNNIGFVFGNGTSNSPKYYTFTDNPPKVNGDIKYRLKQIDNDGQTAYSNILTFNFSITSFELYQNYPNPFNPGTTISWHSPIEGNVKIKIFDLLGNFICEILDDYKSAGINQIEFNIFSSDKNISSGIYIYQIEISNGITSFLQSKKMTLLK